jgi:uncharacterized paraquat-inducible protein A
MPDYDIPGGPQANASEAVEEIYRQARRSADDAAYAAVSTCRSIEDAATCPRCQAINEAARLFGP